MEDIDMVARVFFATPSDYKRYETRIVSGVKSMLLLERTTLRLLGYALDLTEELTIQKIIPGKQYRNVKEYVEKIPDDAVDLVVDRSKSTCIEKVQKFIRHGAKHIVLTNLGGDKSVEEYKDVIEHFKT